MMKTALSWLKTNLFKVLLIVLSISALATACFINLSSITNNNLSNVESVAIGSSMSGKLIWSDPLNLPFKLPVYIILRSGFSSVLLFRIVTTSYGFLMAILFYSLLKKWFSKKLAWIATAMFVSSGLFLNYSRVAVPDVLLPLSLIGLLWSTWWIHQSKRINYHIILSAIILISSLYIPGMIWFMSLLILFQKEHIVKFYKKTSKLNLTFAIILSLLLLSPLIRAFVLNQKLIYQWLALPNVLNLRLILIDLIVVPLSLIAKAPINPVFNLGRLPYLDILTICLAIIGLYAFSKRHRLMRTKTLVAAIIISWLLIGFKNQIQINLLLPVIYIAVCAGIMFLLQQWFVVFPKNPVARLVGILLIVGVVSISLYYNFTKYFVVWANNPVSQNSFEIKYPVNLIQ